MIIFAFQYPDSHSFPLSDLPSLPPPIIILIVIMSQISTIKGLSTNYLQNIELTKRYDKHVSKVIQITLQKPNVQHISQEQRRISQVLKRSKEISKSFKEKEFVIKREEENKRLMASLNQIHGRQKIRSDHDIEKSQIKKRNKTIGKEDILRGYEIERQNKKIANSILTNVCDVTKYKRKIEKEIAEYQRLRNHLQKLKPIVTDRDKSNHHLGLHESRQSKNLRQKLKTLQSQPFSEKLKLKTQISQTTPLRKISQKVLRPQ